MAPPANPPRRLPPAILALVVLAGAVLVAWGALALAFPPARVRSLVQAQLAGVLARDVRYGDARIGIFPPVRLSVLEPALAEPGGFARGAMFRARAVHLDLDVMALLGRRIVVRRLVLDGPQLHVVLRPDGTTNLEGVVKEQPAGAKAGKPMDLEVRTFAIRDGRVLVDDLKAARRTALAVKSTVRLTSEAGGARLATAGETELSELAFGPLAARSLGELNTSLAALDWRITHDGKYDAGQDRLALEKLAVAFDRTELALSGLVTDPGPKAVLDLRARGAGLDLAQIAGFLAVADARALTGITASGRLDLDLAIRGALDPARPPVVTGALRMADAGFRYPGAPAGVEGLTLTARFAPDSLLIRDLRARVTSGAAAQPVTASLLVTRFADPVVAFQVRGDVDLAAIAPMVAPRDTRLAGHVALDVRGRGRARDPGSLALDGRAQLRRLSVASPALPRKIEPIDGAITFSPARATVRGLSAKAGASSFTLDATVGRPLALLARPKSVPPAQVDFTLRSPHLDLAELLPTTPGAPLVPNASGGGTVAIGRLKQQKLDVRDVRADVALTPGVVAVPSFALAGYDGRVTGNARFDLDDPRKPVFAVKARVDSVQANAILSTWTPLKDLFQGSLNTTLDLSGEGQTRDVITRTVSAAGRAALANGTFGPTPALEAVAKAMGIPTARITKLQDLKLPFQVERGRVFTDRGTLRTQYGNWVLTGSTGFDGSLDYALSATVPRTLVRGPEAGSMLGAGALTDADGNLLLDLRIGGTAKKPRVGLDTGAMRDRLSGRVSQAITEQRAKVEQQLRDAARARQQAAVDSARREGARLRQAVQDSLARRAGDVFKGFFGKAAKDTTP